MLSPMLLLAVTAMSPLLTPFTAQESSVVLQISTGAEPDTSYTLYSVANTDGFQETTADTFDPVYVTAGGGQGAVRQFGLSVSYTRKLVKPVQAFLKNKARKSCNNI